MPTCTFATSRARINGALMLLRGVKDTWRVCTSTVVGWVARAYTPCPERARSAYAERCQLLGERPRAGVLEMVLGALSVSWLA